MKRQGNFQCGANEIHNSHRRLIGLALLGLLLWLAAPARADYIYWTGASLITDNWAGGVPPGANDVAIFNGVDSGNMNVVNTDFTVAGLQYIGNGTHIGDFGGTVNLRVNGEVNIGYGPGNGGTAIWSNGGMIATDVYFGRSASTGVLEVPAGGTFRLGTATDPISFLGIAYHDLNNYAGTSTAHLDFTVTDPLFETYVGETLWIGMQRWGGAPGAADGTLILGDNSHTRVGTVEAPASGTVGYSARGTGTGLLDATRGSMELHLTDLNVGVQGGMAERRQAHSRWV